MYEYIVIIIQRIKGLALLLKSHKYLWIYSYVQSTSTNYSFYIFLIIYKVLIINFHTEPCPSLHNTHTVAVIF